MGIKIVAKNKRASYDYELFETYEAGLILQGTEVKSLRQGKASLGEAHVRIHDGEAFVYNLTIPQYEFGNITNHAETRKRKLLLHQKELVEISNTMQQKALNLVVKALYFKGPWVKMEIALGRGKKRIDKRQDEKKKEVLKKLRQGSYDV